MQVERQAIESSQSGRLVQSIADKTSRPVDEVRRMYEAQFHRLEGAATIRTYLPVLAARRALEILSKR